MERIKRLNDKPIRFCIVPIGEEPSIEIKFKSIERINKLIAHEVSEREKELAKIEKIILKLDCDTFDELEELITVAKQLNTEMDALLNYQYEGFI